MLFILGLSSTLLLQETDLILNVQEKTLETNREPLLSGPGSFKAEWYRTWGGVEIENWGIITIDSLDNIYQLGLTRSFGAGLDDICLVKYNNIGELQWNRTWGGNKSEMPRALISDSSNNIYIAGHTESFGAGLNDLFLVKYNSSGDLQWNHLWGGKEQDFGKALVLDSSDNIYIAGTTYSFGPGSNAICIVKYNSSGHLQWNQTWGGIESERCGEIALDSSDNIYIAGTTTSFGAGMNDICIVKYNSSGHLQWNQTWGGIESEVCGEIALDSSDSIYITGKNYSSGETDVHLIKYDHTGNEVWNHTWGITGGTGDNRIVLDSSNNIYIGGTITKSIPLDFSIYLVKYNSSGMRLWNQTWNNSDEDVLQDISIDSLDNICITGETTISDEGSMLLLRYDSLGSLISYNNWGGFGAAVGFGIDLDSSDNIYIGGMINSFSGGGADLFIVKFVEEPSELVIHGFDFLILILILSVFSIITVISRFTKTLIRKK